MRFNIDENSTEKSDASISDQLKTFTANMSATQEKILELQEQMKQTIEKEFNNSIKEIFRLVPRLKCFAWNQYSPYFNDGDECVFSVKQVNALSFVPEYASYSYEIEDENDFIIGEYDGANEEFLSNEERNAIQEVIEFIESNDDLMENLYGNHVSVILTVDGAKVEHFEHD